MKKIAAFALAAALALSVTSGCSKKMSGAVVASEENGKDGSCPIQRPTENVRKACNLLTRRVFNRKRGRGEQT